MNVLTIGIRQTIRLQNPLRRRWSGPKRNIVISVFSVRLTLMKGDKDKDGVVQNIHVVSEKIRPQTKVEKEQSVIR